MEGTENIILKVTQTQKDKHERVEAKEGKEDQEGKEKKLHWSYDPGPLPLGALAQGGTLSILSVQAQDSGYATNNVDKAANKTINLLVRSLKNATFQITPKVIQESENIQLGQDLKLSYHMDVVPQEKIIFEGNGANDPTVQESLVSEKIFHDLNTYEVTVKGEEMNPEQENLEVDMASLQQRGIKVSHSDMCMAL
ncbi:hypothetical protein STEG23_012432 [Scotinomys teguina]